MIRTLSLVAVLTLLAGLSLGFFVAEAKTRVAAAHGNASGDPVTELKVRRYVDYYGLDERQATEVRSALREYDQSLMDLLRRLRARHQDEFRALAEKADARIRAAVGGDAGGERK